MRGASRASYAELRERLDAAVSTARAAEQTGDELFAIVRLLDSEHGLRRALADPTKPSEEKAAVARRLLHGKVSAVAEGLTADAAAARWATPGDMADGIEQLIAYTGGWALGMATPGSAAGRGGWTSAHRGPRLRGR